jgi:hypothetical protein
MKAKYTFSVLRYVHDIVSGEFVNLGIVLFAPRLRYLGIACTTTYGRISKFFGEVQGEHLKKLIRHIQTGVEDIGSKMVDQLPFESLDAKTVTNWVERILPPDDSSLR